MATLVRIPLSASANGRLINLGSSATPGTPVHSAAGGSTIDYITLRASNQSSASVVVTLECGGTTDASVKKIEIPGHAGDMTILDRKPLGSSLVLAAFATLNSCINLDGWVDRETT